MRSVEPGAMSTPAPDEELEEGEYADATRPNDVGAVRSPDAEDRAYEDETAPEGGATASDPSMTGASTYGTTAPTGESGAGGESGVNRAGRHRGSHN